MVKVSPLMTGFAMGLWMAIAQAIIRITPPDVHGICFVSHPNDIWSWTLNKAFGTSFYVHDVSAVIPVLTVLGLPIGAFIAARQHGEWRYRPSRDHIGNFVLGFLVINFGLILGSCPIKTTGLVAYGDPLLLIGFLAIIAGVILSVEFIKWRVRR